MAKELKYEEKVKRLRMAFGIIAIAYDTTDQISKLLNPDKLKPVRSERLLIDWINGELSKEAPDLDLVATYMEQLDDAIKKYQNGKEEKQTSGI